jgi:hypothetical protein
MVPGWIRMETPDSPFEIGNWATEAFLSVTLADHFSLRFLESESECRQLSPGRIGNVKIVWVARGIDGLVHGISSFANRRGQFLCQRFVLT